MNIYWYKALQTTLPDYDAYGVQRGGDATDWNSEMNPVFWNKTKYTALEKNTFWLSETPNKASRYTYTDENGQPGQAGCYRICSYVVLQDRTTGKRLLFLNTHLDNASQQAADFGAEVIIEHLTALQAKYGKDAAVVLTGDLTKRKRTRPTAELPPGCKTAPTLPRKPLPTRSGATAIPEASPSTLSSPAAPAAIIPS